MPGEGEEEGGGHHGDLSVLSWQPHGLGWSYVGHLTVTWDNTEILLLTRSEQHRAKSRDQSYM